MAVMNIPPGMVQDSPEVLSAPRWEVAENVRWTSEGLPETIPATLRPPIHLNPDAITGTGNSFTWAYAEGFATDAVNGGALVLLGSGDRLLAVYTDSAGPAPVALTAVDITPTSSWTGLPSEPTTDRYLAPLPTPVWNAARVGNKLLLCMPNSASAGSPSSAAFFEWDMTTPATEAAPVTGIGPTVANSILVTSDQIVVLFGAEPVSGSAPPELTIRWSNQGAYSASGDWTPSDTNTAGDLPPPPIGGRIIRGLDTGLGILYWTDRAFYLLRELRDGQYFFGSRFISDDGLIASRAVIEAAGKVWFMAADFTVRVWSGGGVPKKVPCPIQMQTVDLMKSRNSGYIVAFSNTEYDEVGWIFERGGGYDDRVAIVYNYVVGAWSLWTGVMASRSVRVGRMPAISFDENYGTDEWGPDGGIVMHDQPVDVEGAVRGLDEFDALLDDTDTPDRGAIAWKLRTTRFFADPARETTRRQSIMDRLRIPQRLRRPAGATGSGGTFDVVVRGWRELGVSSVDAVMTWDPMVGYLEPRVEGRVHSIEMSSAEDDVVRRFGPFDLRIQPETAG